jgi:hypothetical protein
MTQLPDNLRDPEAYNVAAFVRIVVIAIMPYNHSDMLDFGL